jgi:hypothetical protein
MPGGITDSQQFVGISVRKPYEDAYGPVLQKYEHTENGIEEAHGHADELAQRLNIPRQAIRVAAYGTKTEMTGEVSRPAKKAAAPKARASKSVAPKAVPVAKAAKAAPALDEVTVTKGGKSSTYKLGK